MKNNRFRTIRNHYPNDGSRSAAESRERSARFRQIMLPHMDAVYSVARYLSKNPDAAEEIAQDTFHRAYWGFDSWRGKGAKAWLLTITRHCFVDRLDTSAGRATHSDVESWIGDPPSAMVAHDDAGVSASERNEAAAMRAFVETLALPFRETLVLRDLEGLSYRDIAAITQVHVATVVSHLSRARGMLADHMSRTLPQSEPIAETEREYAAGSPPRRWRICWRPPA